MAVPIVKYARTDKKVENISARNRSIISLIEHGSTPENIATILGFRLSTVCIELRFLEEWGYLKAI